MSVYHTVKALFRKRWFWIVMLVAALLGFLTAELFPSIGKAP
jgi:hypothetical protein